MNRVPYIRPAARAIIIYQGNLLVLKMRTPKRVFYILPGGGQMPGETLEETVQRECLEEVSLRVKVGPVAYIREYIGRNHHFNPKHKGFHQLETVFFCTAETPESAHSGATMDNLQEGIEWIPLADILNYEFYPKSIRSWFTEDGFQAPRIYLGDVN